MDAALKDLRAEKIPDAPPSAKRKHRESNDADIGASSFEPLKKRGRPRKVDPGPSAQSVSAPAAPRTRARNPDPRDGLLTRRQAAQSRGDNISPTRSWKPAARSPRKATASKKDGSGATSSKLKNDGVKPKSTGQVFDGVEIVKRPHSYVGKGKERETEEPESDEVEAGSDVDAEGEVVDDAIELETGTSSLENSNKGAAHHPYPSNPMFSSYFV